MLPKEAGDMVATDMSQWIKAPLLLGKLQETREILLQKGRRRQQVPKSCHLKSIHML